MLDRLPNEILLKIFKKTDVKITQSCQLLNKRSDILIREYGPQKENVMRIYAYLKECGKFGIMVRLRSDPKSLVLDTECSDYKEMVDQLSYLFSKSRIVDVLLLSDLQVDKPLLDVIKQQLSSLKRLTCIQCTLMGEALHQFFSGLNHKRVSAQICGNSKILFELFIE